jgi:DNA-binding NarL/FixJ family response regulator
LEVRIVLTEATIAIRVALVGGLPLNHDATRALLDREGFEVAMNGSADIVLVDHDDDAPPIRDIRAQYSQAPRAGRGPPAWTTSRARSSCATGPTASSARDARATIWSRRSARCTRARCGSTASSPHADGRTCSVPARRNDADRTRIASLTARERDVVNLVGEGLANKAIAERLSISDNTVRHHLTSIFSKLGVTDRLSLVVYAFKHKVV